MPKAVRFSSYGGVDVLEVVEVPRPVPAAGQVLVRVKAAGINPGEGKIRRGLLHERYPATFPSGEGSDLAGVVEQVGAEVDGFAVGDEVVGWTDRRASHAEYVVVDAANLVAKPVKVSWEAAGALFVAGTTAYAAVRAVGAGPGDTVVVSAAAGGVGSLAVQLARLAGAEVVGIAGAGNRQWLRDHGVRPVAYGDGVAARIGEVAGGRVDAFIDTFGGEYVEIALELGVDPARVETIANFPAVAKFGVKGDGSATAASADVMRELLTLVADGRLEVPIARTYPLNEVREAFRELEDGHVRGKIVLVP